MVCVNILILSLLYNVVHTSNIVAVTPTPFFSHAATFRLFWKELAKRGHNITLITAFPMEPNDNITQIDISIAEFMNKSQMINFLEKKGNPAFLFEIVGKIFEKLNYMATTHLTNPEVQDLMEEEKYHCDLFITELYLPWFFSLGKKLGCPIIAISSMDGLEVFHSYLGNAIHPAIYASPDMNFENKLTFKNRLQNTVSTVLQTVLVPKLFSYFDTLAYEYIGKDIPPVTDIQKSTSLLFVNANPIFFRIRPSTPLTINIGGGIHLKKPEPLPKEIQEYLDQSKHGCIYFSLGTTVSTDYLNREAIKIFNNVFEQLDPIRVLWKFDNKSLLDMPKNVMIRKWLPQQDILRHRNIKMFITQGGLHSLEEAIDSAVPVLGVPFYGDQLSNVNVVARKKIGLKLDIKTVNESVLKQAIIELIENSTYKQNIKKLSEIAKDLPMTPLEKAVWWAEYVIRNGGTEHLRSPSADIPYYQYFFLDIMAFLIVFFILIGMIFYTSFKVIRFLIRKIFHSKKKEKVN